MKKYKERICAVLESFFFRVICIRIQTDNEKSIKQGMNCLMFKFRQKDGCLEAL